ncbi:methyl-accepting chemotaxis protein [Catenovulum sediminis]|uniref:Methyl-accepting chemotaxis protein n=1 Tax=Catenovulum sediminis TaxID=1740262 RepID=A0ABV1REQ3_9ALTE
MQLLNQVKIKTRIIALVLIPLIVILALSVERLSKAFEQKDKIQELNVVLDYANVAYPYISLTLQEAFYSRLYIDSAPDKSNFYRKKVQAVRKNAVKNQQEYLTFVQQQDDNLTQFPVLYGQIKQLKNLIETTKYIREAVDQKVHILKASNNELGRDLHTMYEMTFLIRRLVLSLSEIVVIATQNEELGKMSNAYYNLVSANVEYSFHNSFVSAAMNGVLDVYIFGEIFRSATKTQNDLQLFSNFASPKAQAAYQKMLNNEHYKTAEKIALQARSDIYKTVNKPVVIDQNLDWDQITSKVFEVFHSTTHIVLEELVETKNQLVEDAQFLVYQTIGLLIAVLVLLSMVSFVIASSITNPLKTVVRSCKDLATNKDMSVRLDEAGKDELAELSYAFNSLLDSFNTTLRGVDNEAKIIGQRTKQVAQSMSQSSTLSDSQLRATDSISVAINEMTATISEVANMATSTSDAVQTAHEISVNSAKNAAISQQTMENLTIELGNTSNVVNQLNEESTLIGNVLNVIQGIAEQTNLLALNAAIEAARAGELGRGFAVVADEVRSLASRTQESTEQIRQQIEALQKGAQAATNNMAQLQEEGSKAVELVVENAEAFNVMKSELDKIMQMAVQIATAAEEQTSVSNEINERIIAIKDDADKITTITVDTTQTSNQLEETGQRLNHHISEFVLKH